MLNSALIVRGMAISSLPAVRRKLLMPIDNGPVIPNKRKTVPTGKREHHLLQTAIDDGVLLVQSNYATAKRQLEIVYDQVRIDLCTQKTSDANMLIWDAVCERESDISEQKYMLKFLISHMI